MEREPEGFQDLIPVSLAKGIRANFAGDHFGDVMVLGGGISGIQASLDLAHAGFKVYLVDKAPAIGGHMAQLDKTFPTNDCSI
jgi:heterodisulfide reductase subunit A